MSGAKLMVKVGDREVEARRPAFGRGPLITKPYFYMELGETIEILFINRKDLKYEQTQVHQAGFRYGMKFSTRSEDIKLIVTRID